MWSGKISYIMMVKQQIQIASVTGELDVAEGEAFHDVCNRVLEIAKTKWFGDGWTWNGKDEFVVIHFSMWPADKTYKDFV